MMEQWRFKRYDITVYGKSSSIYRGKKPKGEKIAETLCAYFFSCYCLMCYPSLTTAPLYMRHALDDSDVSVRARAFFCVLFATCKSRINCPSLSRSLSPLKMSCQNECKINWLPEDSITCFACIVLYIVRNFCTPVISVNYKWNAPNWWKSNLSVCIKNYINQIRIS